MTTRRRETVRDFDDLVEEAERRPTSGWDFRFLDGRLVEGPLPWSYEERARRLVRAAREPVLDLGTGGGEFLSSLAPLPPGSRATEGWPPNVPVARRRLAALAVDVVEPGPDGSLPLPSGGFGAVLDRHEAYDPAEVRRVLAPGGVFLTQQVGGDDGYELSALLEGPPPDRNADWDLDAAVAGLEGAGLAVTRARRARPLRRFHDVGALVSYLRMVPWQVPGFDARAHRGPLLRLHRDMARGTPLTCTVHRFLVEACGR
ncbi:class I SAM-dependent methyltransferase [Nocardiopsis sp. HUAS JQ3]|uniref:class I SAM-dependent methyltransferase n=1 Tax=Nocardiopsis sp. HUAS JQ3 TaxID=3061629 RepID=UPI0023A93AC7|nr:class I SAM-dependent methyltransferase [Nocardiopsis sp. HUAS JQ3]WDZ93240.1 class I SAM-dependent methyltransferase [Nocardiopsis sp. HUAS JQ3]